MVSTIGRASGQSESQLGLRTDGAAAAFAQLWGFSVHTVSEAMGLSCQGPRVQLSV